MSDALRLKNDFDAYALEHYDNPNCKTYTEFCKDLARIGYLKKLLNREDYISTCHLTLNHIITLYNVFDRYQCTVMLFYRVGVKNWCKLATYLRFLSLMPGSIPELELTSIELPTDNQLLTALKCI